MVWSCADGDWPHLRLLRYSRSLLDSPCARCQRTPHSLGWWHRESQPRRLRNQVQETSGTNSERIETGNHGCGKASRLGPRRINRRTIDSSTKGKEARMARARVEQHPATGTTLVVMVGLSIAFLLFIAFLNVVKTGSVLSEANLLYAALVFYAGAGALYLGFGITGTDSYIKFASLATWAGLIANTGAVAHRWYEAGHPPFASIYEMLLMFVWTLAVLTLIAEQKFKVKVIGTVTMPLAIVGVVLMQLLRTGVRPLVPALQSTWLHVHVTLAMLAYAACALSFALAMMFLIQDKMKTETFLAATSLFSVLTYVGVLTRFEKWGGLSVVAWNPDTKSEAFLSRGVRLFVVIPDLGWLLLLVLAAVAAPLVLYLLWRKTHNEGTLEMANRAVFLSILLQVLALAFFLVRTRDGVYSSLDAEGLFPTTLAASPFILSGLVGSIL